MGEDGNVFASRFPTFHFETKRGRIGKEKVVSDVLIDKFGRKITSLRISLTEKCQFRCLYCMPPEGLPACSSNNLSKDEIHKFARIACSLGIQRIRLTGGEPLLRKDVTQILESLAQIDGLQDLALTTNGFFLKKKLSELIGAGLQRINISLDSLNRETFHQITKTNCFDNVLSGIDAALKTNLPVKLNVVVMNGVNDHEIGDFVNFALDHSVDELRFIEFMPLCGTGWKPYYVYPFNNMISELEQAYNIQAVSSDLESVASSYIVEKNGKRGKIGLITTLSRPFCNRCSRLRLSANGEIRPCLFSDKGISVKDYLKDNVSDECVRSAILKSVLEKPEGNAFAKAKKERVPLDVLLKKQNQFHDNPMIRSIGG